MNKGKIIAAFGIPGSGKSSTVKEIGQIINSKTFFEPEEHEWGRAVKERNISGNFTSVMWFRAMRIPLLYDADKCRDNGSLVFIDSYYDKLISLYMRDPGLSWFVDPADPYFEELEKISKKDYLLLPDVDCIVFFKVDYQTWMEMIQKRNRTLDNDTQFIDKCYQSQNAFISAAQRYCTDRNAILIIIEQILDSAKATAHRVLAELKNSNII